MRENLGEVMVGAAVVAIAAGFLVYAAQTTGLTGQGGGYPVTASFRSIEGVQVGTDVRLAGVKIGTVTGLALNPETFRAETTLTLIDGVAIPDDSTAAIASESLLGGTFVEIIPGGSLDNLPVQGEILDTQGAVSVISLLLKFVTGDQSQ